MNQRPNILIVCGRNKRRSRTAEYIFKNDSRFQIRSVGLSPASERQLKEKDVHWADRIYVMERGHKARITEAFRHLALPPLEVLHIKDEYDYLQPELVELLTVKLNESLKAVFAI